MATGSTHLQSKNDTVASDKERGECGESNVPGLDAVLEENLRLPQYWKRGDIVQSPQHACIHHVHVHVHDVCT